MRTRTALPAAALALVALHAPVARAHDWNMAGAFVELGVWLSGFLVILGLPIALLGSNNQMRGVRQIYAGLLTVAVIGGAVMWALLSGDRHFTTANHWQCGISILCVALTGGYCSYRSHDIDVKDL